MAAAVGLVYVLYKQAKAPALNTTGGQQWASTYSGPVGPMLDLNTGKVVMAPLYNTY
jgi:hypothetical protein